jgi:hypothetical protein
MREKLYAPTVTKPAAGMAGRPTVPRGPAFRGFSPRFAAVRGSLRQSGRTVRVGFLMRFSGCLRSHLRSSFRFHTELPARRGPTYAITHERMLINFRAFSRPTRLNDRGCYSPPCHTPGKGTTSLVHFALLATSRLMARATTSCIVLSRSAARTRSLCHSFSVSLTRTILATGSAACLLVDTVY